MIIQLNAEIIRFLSVRFLFHLEPHTFWAMPKPWNKFQFFFVKFVVDTTIQQPQYDVERRKQMKLLRLFYLKAFERIGQHAPC